MYYKNQIRPNGNIYWICIHYNTENSCPTSVTKTGVNTEIVSFSRKDHSLHPLVDEIDVKVRDMVNNVKKRTRSEKYPIKQNYRSEINKLITETKDLESIYEKVPKYDSVKNDFYKVRREEMPRLPKKISEISLNLDRFCMTIKTIVYSSLSSWPLHNEIDDFLDVIGSLYQFKDEKSPENSRQTENEVKMDTRKPAKRV
ncbi:unnamed protein product [Brachionus calyciflorus]|uniref:FLYWCH-type domain-containing protein n=1 Tax=Brachionus calyciflorus TaxID=104777 RepID=A0A813R8P0_9BILA|nr:unnamed protein product [Brachionus calyciflorus]